MYYKLFNEDGEYREISTGDRKNLMKVEWAETPDGPNVGWKWYDTDEEALLNFELEEYLEETRIDEKIAALEAQILDLESQQEDILEQIEVIDKQIEELENLKTN